MNWLSLLLSWSYYISIWFFVYMFSVFCHELGHVIASRYAGFVPTTFGLGFGKPIWWIRFGSLSFYVGRKNFLGGLTFSHIPYLQTPRWSMIVMALGGFVVNFLLVAVALVLWLGLGWNNYLIDMLLWNNLILGVFSAIPIESKQEKSLPLNDGAIIRQHWRGDGNASLFNPIYSYEGHKDLLQKVNDKQCLVDFALGAAATYHVIGDDERAKDCWESHQNHIEALSPSTQFMNLYINFLLLCSQHKLDEAHQVYSRLKDISTKLSQPASEVYLSMLETTLALQEKNMALVEKCIDTLENKHKAQKQEDQRSFFSTLVEQTIRNYRIALAMNQGDVERTQQREKDLRTFLSKEKASDNEFILWFELAEWYQEKACDSDATRVYNNAILSFQQLYWESPRDYQERFYQLHSPRLTKARMYLEEQGDTKAIDELEHQINNREILHQEIKVADKEERIAKSKRNIRSLLLFNFLCAVGIGSFLNDSWLKVVGTIIFFVAALYLIDIVFRLLFLPFKRWFRYKGGLVLWLTWVMTFSWILYVAKQTLM